MAGKKTGKRLLTWVLVLVMALSLLPLNALAAEADEAAALQMSDEDNSDDRSLMPAKGKTYTITFDANGGKLSNGKAKFDVTYDSKSNPLDSHDAASNNILKEAPTYPAHKFLNWYYVGGLTGIHYPVNSNTKIREVLTLSSNNTVYAKWGLADGFEKASIFYLKDPTKNRDSNTGEDWNGPLGGKEAGFVDTTGFNWEKSPTDSSVYNSKNVKPDDVTWPTGFGTTNAGGLELNKNTDEWNAIFEAFKTKVEADNGVGSLTKDDVYSITLVPYKVSRGNQTDGSYHVDCDVVIKCNFVTVDFVVKNDSNVFASILSGKMTCPKGQAFPKDNVPAAPEKDGYEFDGWYTNEECKEKADFDKPLTKDTTFYGKYTEKETPNPEPADPELGENFVFSADKMVVKFICETTIDHNDSYGLKNGHYSVSDKKKSESGKWRCAIEINLNKYFADFYSKDHPGHIRTNPKGEISCVVYYLDWNENLQRWTASEKLISATEIHVKCDAVTPPTEFIPVTLTANSDTVTYNGEEQTVTGYTSNAPEGVTFEGITATGSGTNADEYTVKFSDDAVGKTDTTGKYIVAKTVDGKLTINKCPILITAKGFTTVYNGKSPVVEDYTILRLDSNGEYVNGLPTGHKIDSYVTYGSGVDAGEYKRFSMDKAKIVDAKDKDVTSNYDIGYENRTLTINKRSVTLTSETASKPYDGTPLTRPTVTVGGDGFVEGEVTDIRATGSVTYVSEGEVTNTITFTKGQKFKDSNYDITKDEGTLTITEASAPTPGTFDFDDVVYGDGKVTPAITKTVKGNVGRNFKETFKVTVEPKSDNAKNTMTPDYYTGKAEVIASKSLKDVPFLFKPEAMANAVVPYGELRFTEAGTYTYTVREVPGGTSRMSYDTTEYTLTIKVVLNENANTYQVESWQFTAGNSKYPTPLNIVNTYRTYHPSAPSKPTLNTGDHYAYVMGYPDGMVRPNGSITRAEVSTILFRLLSDKTRDEYFTTESSFTDVKAGAWYNNSIATLEKAGVIVDTAKGGAFRPNEAITRAELAAMLAQFSDAKPVKGVKFSDVSAEHWAYEAIAIAAKMGWIEGYPDGTFRPDATITRAEMMTLVNRALDRVPSDEDHLLSKRVMLTFPDCKSGDWFYIAVQEATNSHTYERAATEKNGDEQWTALRANRDWTLLEK